ncbi:inositol phosphatase [Theileria orientalis]|uniref:Inositol phosphatase n=1 Tax=Theileria orientalis TaxID=68886 RepID=A0A976M4X1_THEOR|nr:inositol phosphatase [Theileria orientalis]
MGTKIKNRTEATNSNNIDTSNAESMDTNNTNSTNTADTKSTESSNKNAGKKRFSLLTLFKRVDKKLVPLSLGDNTDKTRDPIRIFVGTWNMGFKKIDQKDVASQIECTCPPNSKGCTCVCQYNDPLRDWIDLNYDIYLITLQESVSPNFVKIISKYLERSNRTLVKINLKNYRIMGFGEGAYVSRKMTVISAWINKKLLDEGLVKIGCSRQVYVSSYNRSKGVVCFQMKVYEQILCFIGGHMPSDYMERQKACHIVLDKLSTMFGANEGLTFKDVFHHVIWAGDFNFKLMIALEKVIENIQNGTLSSLIKYDEFYLPSSMLKDKKFREDNITFDPTYKKKENRTVVNKEDKDWFMHEYALSDVKWYGNYNTQRIPSWTDRILKWSDESMESCLRIEPKTYKASLPNRRTVLMSSDHTPLSCGFSLLPVSKSLVPPVKLNLVLGTNSILFGPGYPSRFACSSDAYGLEETKFQLPKEVADKIISSNPETTRYVEIPEEIGIERELVESALTLFDESLNLKVGLNYPSIYFDLQKHMAKEYVSAQATLASLNTLRAVTYIINILRSYAKMSHTKYGNKESEEAKYALCSAIVYTKVADKLETSRSKQLEKIKVESKRITHNLNELSRVKSTGKMSLFISAAHFSTIITAVAVLFISTLFSTI